MKLFVTLNILATVVAPAKITELRTDPERGSEALTWAIIASVALGIALAVGLAITAATNSYTAQIHG
ncbi:MAG: hypothetical protein LCH96_14690 [Actinobacteria bacterium]|nr:hypothetical protein [Actinomycetota bacterium]